MQEPLDPMDRPISRTSDDNDVNLSYTEAGRTTATDRRSGRGFTTTFAIVAAVLLAAFLVALYLGAEGTNTATVPSDTVPPVADTAPATPDDATGSTTTVQPTEPDTAEPADTPPAPGGTTAPVNPPAAEP
jgi:YD repeat-containing protein